MVEGRSYEFQVAVSFAGEDREYVTDFVREAEKAGAKVYLDADHLAETWGEDLVEYFDRLFTERAQFAVMFVSRHYAEKTWTRRERRAALSRAIEQRSAYILPIRLDDTVLQGLLPTVGYLDANRMGIAALVETLMTKLGSPVPATAPDRAPRTEVELDLVERLQPPGWEFLLFAGCLAHELALRSARTRDYEMGYAPIGVEYLSDDDIPGWVSQRLSEIQAITARQMAVMRPEVQAVAFGAPGQPGDAAAIRQLARRWTGMYDDLLGWVERIRSLPYQGDLVKLVEVLARVADHPIALYRTFVSDLVAATEGLSSRLATGESVRLAMDLIINMDPDVERELNEEIERAYQDLSMRL